MLLSFMAHSRGRSDFRFLQIDTEAKTYRTDLWSWDAKISMTALKGLTQKCIKDGYKQIGKEI